MRNERDILTEIEEKYGEWFETIPESLREDLIINILCKKLLIAEQDIDFLNKLVQGYRNAAYRTDTGE